MGSVKKIPIGSPSQISAESDFGKFLSQYIGKSATPFGGQLTADIPELFTGAFSNLSDMMGRYNEIINEALTTNIKGISPYISDFGNISKRFNENFATPLMETFRRTVLPAVREGYNAVPGGLRSAALGRGMENVTSRFFQESVQPKLFDAFTADLNRQFVSGENAAARRLPAIGSIGVGTDIFMSAAERFRQAQQQGLTADYGEFLRTTPEASPWLGAVSDYLKIPTNEIAVKQGTKKGGVLGGLTGGLGGLAGGAAVGLGPLGILLAGGLGAYGGSQ